MLTSFSALWSLGLMAALAGATSGQQAAGGACSDGGDEGTCAPSLSSGSALIQKGAMSDRLVAEELDPSEEKLYLEFNKVGQARPARDIIEYFKAWSEGEIEYRSRIHDSVTDLHTRPGASLLAVGERVTASYVADVLGSHRELFCQASSHEMVAGGWSLHSSSTGADGVHHAMLLSSEGRVHYVAMRNGRVLASDPPACPHGRALLDEASLLSLHVIGGGSNGTAPIANPPAEDPAGEAEAIGNDDPLVVDAISYFEQFINYTCNTMPQVNVFAATVEVMDPLETIVRGEVNGECITIKVSHKYKQDASSLIQGDNSTRHPSVGVEDEAKFVDLFVDDYTPATLCSIGQKGGGCTTARLMEIYKFGDNSKEKAHQWEMDLVPKIHIDSFLGTQTSVDLRQTNPTCFPGTNSAGVVRNQGNCGSCWAFASATTLMHNLCASNPASSSNVKANGDRFEISVQQIMSCNTGKRGCKGGNAYGAGTACAGDGLDKDKDAPYQCGSGNPLNHFQAGGHSCKAWPWGVSCDKALTVPAWTYHSVASVKGEPAMMSMLAMGQALYVRFDVYSSFMKSSWHGTVYQGPNDGKTGGHAVNALGYGEYGGVKYWLLQNSWGNWNDNGYCMFVRGQDFAGIEQGAEWFKVETAGGTQPPCFDGTSTGYSAGGSDITCAQAPQYNLCSYASVKGTCPVTCGVCSATPTPPPSPTPPPTPVPTPPPTAAPVPTAGHTTCRISDPGFQCVGYQCVTHQTYHMYSDNNGDAWCLAGSHSLCKKSDASWCSNECKCPTQCQHACGRCPPQGGSPSAPTPLPIPSTPPPTPRFLPNPTPAPGPPPSGGQVDKCGFENSASSKLHCNMWKEQSSDQFDWTRKSGGTPSGSTGPQKGAAEGNYYVYIEASSPRRNGDKAILTASNQNLQTGASLTFKYNMYGGKVKDLKVTVDGQSPAFTKTGNQGQAWQTATVSLDQYVGQSVTINFEATRGTSWNGDIAIDDISLDHGSGGAAPTAPPMAPPMAPPTGAPTGAPMAPPTGAPMAPPTGAPMAPPMAAPTGPPQPSPNPMSTDAKIQAMNATLGRIETKIDALSAAPGR